MIQEIPGGTRFNLESDSEHVPEIERQIRVEKERIRSIIHSLTFNKAPKLFLIYLVFQAIKMLNHFPVKGGISDIITLTKIMTGKSLHYKNISVYILDITVKYMSKKLLGIAIRHVPRVPYEWDQGVIYKEGSSL